MTDYCIECEFTLAKLVERVNEMMREGYRPVGGPFRCYPDEAVGRDSDSLESMICQAMIKKEIEDAQA